MAARKKTGVVVLTASGIRELVRVSGRPGWDGIVNVASVTESLDAAWALAEANGLGIAVWTGMGGVTLCELLRMDGRVLGRSFRDQANTPALAICAALVAAAEGKETHA